MKLKKQMEGFLSANIYQRFEEKGITVEEYLDCDDNTERAAMLGHKNPGNFMVPMILEFSRYLPRLEVTYAVKPIAQTILKIDLSIIPIFRFSNKWHSKSEIFWILFDNGEELLHSETISIEEEFITKER
jgi:pre-mRNA-splicing helicase BRR2